MHIFTKQMKKFQVSMLKKRQTYVVSEKKLHDSLDQIITLCMAKKQISLYSTAVW